MEEQRSTNRRRFFKRAALATLFGGLAAGIGLKAWARGGHGRDHWSALDPAMVDERLDRVLKHLYVEIDASEEQKAKLAPIVKGAAKDLLPLREKLHDARRQAIAVLGGERVDRGAIESLRAGQIALADQASQRFTRALGDVAEVLTPAQRKDLAERVARHRRGWQRG